MASHTPPARSTTALRTAQDACPRSGSRLLGFAYGATDEFGHAAVQDKVHMHDLHATILHVLGLDHERLTYRFQGRDFRLTDVHGRVVSEIFA
jgi:hypothetical protein